MSDMNRNDDAITPGAEDERPATMADFSAMIDAQLAGYRGGFDPGERVEATVIEVSGGNVVLDVKAKREGIVPLTDLEEIDPAGISPGDKMEVWFAGMREGAFLFSPSLGSTAAVERSLSDAFASQMPVEGVVVEEVKGGYRVDIAGKRAFCPYSQIGLFRSEDESFIGQRLGFLVSEYEDGNCVLSRRALLEREQEARREELRETLRVGDQREGTVSRLVDFGVFVDIGGVEGLVPLSELAWQRRVKPEEVVKPGETVQVAVREIDWERNRISLSLREALPDPWIGLDELFPVGRRFRGRITHLEPFGAFVELRHGAEGLVPVSWLGGGRRLRHPREMVAEGDELELRVEAIDPSARRASLRPVDTRVERVDPASLVPGAEVEGVVEGVRDFGVFVRLSEERTGLLHFSRSGLAAGGNHQGKLEQAFPPGTTLRVVVESLDGKRISLSLPGAVDNEGDGDEAEAFLRRQPGGRPNLGSLADALGDLDL